MARYDLFNPTGARRIIYDGLKNRRLEVLPGQRLSSIALADHVVTRLRDMAKAAQGKELEVTEAQADAAPAGREMKIQEGGVTVLRAKPVQTAKAAT